MSRSASASPDLILAAWIYVQLQVAHGWVFPRLPSIQSSTQPHHTWAFKQSSHFKCIYERNCGVDNLSLSLLIFLLSLFLEPAHLYTKRHIGISAAIIENSVAPPKNLDEIQASDMAEENLLCSRSSLGLSRCLLSECKSIRGSLQKFMRNTIHNDSVVRLLLQFTGLLSWRALGWKREGWQRKKLS